MDIVDLVQAQWLSPTVHTFFVLGNLNLDCRAVFLILYLCASVSSIASDSCMSAGSLPFNARAGHYRGRQTNDQPYRLNGMS